MSENANQLPLYETRGVVIPGRGVGKSIGIPTANLKIEDEDRLPEPGVYISRIFLAGQTLYGVTHIGARPTFDDSKEVSFETHILDFDRNIYGCEMQIQLFLKIRLPQKFDDVSSLLRQIKQDSLLAKEYWGLE